MARINPIIIVAVCTLAFVCPATSISRYFSSSYADLHVTLKRYAHCVGSLEPLSEPKLNHTDYLIRQMRLFLDGVNLDNEQLANVTLLMDNICQRVDENTYPISLSLNVEKYSNTANGTSGKTMRCRGLDQAMDSMYVVFKRTALNKTEPLDFSTIKFYNDTTKEHNYTIYDLINTIWIKSEVDLELVCKITDSIKDYIHTRSLKTLPASRSQRPETMSSYLYEMINSFLDTVFGLQKRIYWESNNRFAQLWYGMGNVASSAGSLFSGSSNSTTKMTTNRTVVLTNSTSKTTTTPSLQALSPSLNVINGTAA